MLHLCAEHAKKEKKKTDETSDANDDAQAADTPADGDGDVAMGDDVARTPNDAPTREPPAAGEADATTAPDVPVVPAIEAPVPPPPGEVPEAAEEEEVEGKPLKHQAVATIGIALIAMGEEVGAEMALRQYQHLVSWPWTDCRWQVDGKLTPPR